MCHNLYIAARKPLLPMQNNCLIHFHLTEPDEYRLPFLQSKFTFPHIYAVGAVLSLEGKQILACGCNLHKGDEIVNDLLYDDYVVDEDYHRVQALYDFLSDETQDDALELYSCWDGDEELPIVERGEIAAHTLILKNGVYLPTIERFFYMLPKTEKRMA